VYVFVDESGDLGFANSSKFFTVAYLMCESPHRIQVEMKRALKQLHQKKQYSIARNELKFSRMDNSCRRYVLEKISESEVNLGVIVLEKALVKPDLRTDPIALYSWCVVHNVLLSLVSDLMANKKVHVVFDRRLPTWRINEFNAYVETKADYFLARQGLQLPADCILASHVASELEPGLQAVDAVAGAYFQKYEHQNSEYVQLIESRVSAFRYLWGK
jgi:hypothetical protein